MARKYIVEENNLKRIEDKYILTGSEVKHIRVLRYKPTDVININNANYEITCIKKEEIILKYISDAKEVIVEGVLITLLQALLKADKMEFVIQKAVELGAKEIIPFKSSNVVVKLDQKDIIKKLDRWNKISVEATKQCGRSDIVNVSDVINIEDIKIISSKFDYIIFAYENSENDLKESINKIKEDNLGKKLNIAVIIGAEGGFTKDESDFLNSISNVRSVSLGNRILRAETASLNLISILIYELS